MEEQDPEIFRYAREIDPFGLVLIDRLTPMPNMGPYRKAASAPKNPWPELSRLAEDDRYTDHYRGVSGLQALTRLRAFATLRGLEPFRNFFPPSIFAEKPLAKIVEDRGSKLFTFKIGYVVPTNKQLSALGQEDIMLFDCVFGWYVQRSLENIDLATTVHQELLKETTEIVKIAAIQITFLR